MCLARQPARQAACPAGNAKTRVTSQPETLYVLVSTTIQPASQRTHDMTELRFNEGFPTPTEADWRALVDKALKGGNFEKRLVTRTADGLAIQPLYTRSSAVAGGQLKRQEDSAVAGGQPKRQQETPWTIAQRYADEQPTVANAAILDDLKGGVAAVTLQIAAPGQFGLPYHEADLAAALRGVLLDSCAVNLDAGEYTTDAAGSLMALWRQAGTAELQRSGGFGYDPFAILAATGALYHQLPQALAIAADLVRTAAPMPHVTALAASGQVYHAAGATEAQEIAAVASSIVAYLRAAEAAGIKPVDALPKIAVSLAVDTDQFLGMAKLRAARRIVHRIAEASGAANAASAVKISAETSSRMMARRDPWVNMLRTTIACAAAAMGGAETITVLPFTQALGRPDAFARRMARNTHHVLMEESALHRVADPAGGSWYVESLTTDLAAKAWEMFQALEAKGGIGAALASGALQDDIAKAAADRAKLVATGRLELTGSSAYAKLGDDGVAVEPWPMLVPSADLNGARVKPLRPQRLAEPFESLRDRADAFTKRTGIMPRLFLASLGPLAVHSTRSTWIANFLAAGGIDVIANEGFTETPALGRAFADSGATLACLCSSDQVYGELGEAAAGVLKQAGAKAVYLAGRPREQEATLKAAGVDTFLFAGTDAIAALTQLQAALGIR
ncbi:MAG: methylmalonyl-CoA mutase family protein [Hyphomicrobiaceae bacterium]